MIISVDITEQNKIRLDELKKVTEASTRSDVLRAAIREYHKNFSAANPTTVSVNYPQEPTQ